MEREAFKIISAYFVTIVVALVAAVLLLIIIHLTRIIYKGRKNRDESKTAPDLFFLLVTLLGLISFEISIILTITLFIEIILNSNSTHILKWMIPIFDSLGHISILIVLITRFQFCFRNTIFDENQRLIQIMRIFVILSLLMFIGIIFLIIFTEQSLLILTAEIIWELSIEIMCLWILYLFVTKLYIVLKWSLKCVNPQKSELSLYREFTMSLGPRLSARRPTQTKSKIDTKSKKSDKNKIPKLSDTNLSVSDMPSMPDSNPSISSNKSITADQHNNDLVNIMTKMTLLITVCSISSIFSIIGNTFIEIHELDTVSTHTMDIESIWTFLLPVTDIILTSFMLYLQFRFAEKLYLKMCSKLDVVFLRCGLKFVKYWLKTHNDDGNNNNDDINNNNVERTDELNVQKEEIGSNETNTEKTKTRRFTESDIEIIFDDNIGNSVCIESPKTPLMYLEENVNANQIYKMPAILEKDQLNIQNVCNQ